MTSEKCYSVDGEDYKICDIEDIIIEVFDSADIPVGSVRSIYEANVVRLRASNFFECGLVIKNLQKCAIEDYEFAEGWLDDINDIARIELNARLFDTINQWATKHNLHPTFYEIDSVKEVQVKLLNDDGEWEYVK